LLNIYKNSSKDELLGEIEILQKRIEELEQSRNRQAPGNFNKVAHESESLFQDTFEDAAIGMALVALDGRWLKVNQALCDITGYSQQELISTTFQAITHPDDLDKDLNNISQLIGGKIRSYHSTLAVSDKLVPLPLMAGL
jgi:PAS domain-containing protein